MNEEHGFAIAEIQDGIHASECKDVICDGCASLEDCAICGLAEFEHGDGNE